ncbi:MAG: signal recognition particle-docking protein FtsY [Polyangiaceae bacterium]|nr:signal recognition particle-docking protein FtsY [Polyangiaceae bacterium]
MSTPLILVLVVAVVVVLYFVFGSKKPQELPAKEEADEAPRLKKKDGPTLQEKLDQRREELSKAKVEEVTKPEAAEPAEPAPAKAEEPAKTEPAKPEEPAQAPEPTAAPPAIEAKPTVVARPTKPGDVEGMRKGLAKSRGADGFFGRLAALVTGKKEIDAALLGEIEEVLLASDVGVKATETLTARVRDALSKNELSDPARVWETLRAEARRILSVGGGGVVLSGKPTVVMMVGVNGAGKTTTIGKIATKLHGEGTSVMLAAGDTFRAAAVAQLEVWGKRVGVEVVKGKDGADPAAVAFDAVTKAKAAGVDVLLVDTAGRLHTKSNLMDELKKIGKSVGKAIESAPHETLLVLDATNGQNALAQAKQFKEAMTLTGIVLTKLDGTAKGGIILAIADELGVPVRYVGLGERADDLHEFSADEYVEALLGDLGKQG